MAPQTPQVPQPETVGPFTLYSPAGAEPSIGWIISCGSDWLPGTFDSRDAALLAIGIVLGGEATFRLVELRDHNARALDGAAATVEHITTFAATKATNS
ncbi:hypothetical protein AB0D10_00705 [Kitasatospora sp. NPDC048545]|uniref:hypothetical protein n=1 Tax=Kitasatospora sp. NPDC048545 TaxID=3157208 RepID=UPI0033F47551